MHKFSIKDWAVDDQPRKKLLQKGAAVLSNSELLAILINTGSPNKSALDLAKELLQAADNDLQKLAGLSVQEIANMRIKGLGEAKTIHIAAALELGIRRNASDKKKETISKSADIAEYLRANFEYLQQEVFVVVFLNRGNKVMHHQIISEGGLTGTIADPRVILKKALEHNATSLILCHNHPVVTYAPVKQMKFLHKK